MKLAETQFDAELKGRAHLEVELVFGESTATSSCATSPLKLLTPCARGKSVWAYASNFGGGLVAGDETRLDLRIGPEARCFMGTQASTKVYRNPARLPCSHSTHATLERGSLLVFAPDPVQAFAGSSYRQRQEFHLAKDAALVLVDWFTSGRVARGERWAFDHFQSRNDVFVEGRRIFVDSILLNSETGPLKSPHRTGRFNCSALLLLVGESLREAAAKLLAEIASRPVERAATLLSSASQVRDGVVLR
ncbi:MAG TPA: urease accessory protein UreD, partial [Verrucomicrobiae bacterium]